MFGFILNLLNWISQPLVKSGKRLFWKIENAWCLILALLWTFRMKLMFLESSDTHQQDELRESASKTYLWIRIILVSTNHLFHPNRIFKHVIEWKLLNFFLPENQVKIEKSFFCTNVYYLEVSWNLSIHNWKKRRNYSFGGIILVNQSKTKIIGQCVVVFYNEIVDQLN